MAEPWDADSDSDFGEQLHLADGDEVDDGDDDDDESFEDAVSEQDGAQDEVAVGEPVLGVETFADDAARCASAVRVAFDDDFQECVDGLLRDDGYFSMEAYRGPPGGSAMEHGGLRGTRDGDLLNRGQSGGGRATKPLRGDFEEIAESDIDAFMARGRNELRQQSGAATDGDFHQQSRGEEGTGRGTHGGLDGSVVRSAMSQAAAVALMSGGTRANGDERANETARDLLSSRSLVPRDRLAAPPPTDREELLQRNGNDAGERSKQLGSSGDGAGVDGDGLCDSLHDTSDVDSLHDSSVDSLHDVDNDSEEDTLQGERRSSGFEDCGEGARERRRQRRRALRPVIGDEESESDDEVTQTRDTLSARPAVAFVVPSDRELFLAEEQPQEEVAGAHLEARVVRNTQKATAATTDGWFGTPNIGESRDEGDGDDLSFGKPRPPATEPGDERARSGVAGDGLLFDRERQPSSVEPVGGFSSGGGDFSLNGGCQLSTMRPISGGGGGWRRRGAADAEKESVNPESAWRTALTGEGDLDLEVVDVDRGGRTAMGLCKGGSSSSSSGLLLGNGHQLSSKQPINTGGDGDDMCPPPTPLPSRTLAELSSVAVAARREQHAADATAATVSPPSPLTPPSPPPPPHPVTARPALPRDAFDSPTVSPDLRPRAAEGGGVNFMESALAADPSSAMYPLHAAAYYADLDALRSAIAHAKSLAHWPSDAATVSHSSGSSLAASHWTADASSAPRIQSGAAAAASEKKTAFSAGPSGQPVSVSPLASLDLCGNSALHVAVLRGHIDVLDVLLTDDVGFPLDVRSSTGWTPLQEAVHLGDRRLVKLLFQKQLDRSKREFERKKPLLLATLQSLPDFRMMIHWEFGSMVFGPMLRRYAPSDTYEVTKRGSQLRMDGTLKGVETEEDGTSRSVLPKWKRGAFSLLFEGKTGTTSRLLFVDHEKKEAVDAGDSGDKQKDDAVAGSTEEERIDAEVDSMLSEGSTKRKIKTEEVKFKSVKGWLGGNKKEKVEGWDAEVWEASGLMAKRLVTRAGVFRVHGTFTEYLAAAGEGQADVTEFKPVGSMEDGQDGLEDIESQALSTNAANGELLFDDEEKNSISLDEECQLGTARPANDEYPILGMDDDGFGGPVSNSAQKVDRSPTCKGKGMGTSYGGAVPGLKSKPPRKPLKEAKPRKITARCWLAKDFPLKVDDLLPILDVMSHANKHLKKVNTFVGYWRGEHGGFFPVKVQVPIVMTVYAVMHFRDFALLPRTPDNLGGLPDNHFEVPAGYELKTLGDALKEVEAEELRLLDEETETRERESKALGAEGATVGTLEGGVARGIAGDELGGDGVAELAAALDALARDTEEKELM